MAKTTQIDERRIDGLRFVAAVHVKDNSFKDFFESAKLELTKTEAENKYKETGNPCIIFDRLECMIIERFGEVIIIKEKPVEKKEEVEVVLPKARKKREKKIKRK